MTARRRGVVGDGLLLAFGTLTAVPVPAPSRVDARVAAAGMAAAPLPGAALGGVAALLVWLASLVDLPAGMTAIAAIGAVASATRGIHLDGLADTVDGLAAAPADRERALAVMRKGDVGPSAVVVVVLVLLLQVFALERSIVAGHGPWAALVAVTAGRAVLALMCARGIPSARSDGLGSVVVGSVGRWRAIAVLIVVAAAVTGAALLFDQPALESLLAVVAGWAVAAALAVRCVRRLGGITGDVLGAAVEACVTASLVVLAMA